MATTATWTPIATTTLEAVASSVTFGSIPATDSSGNTIRDLILIMNYGQSSSGYAGKILINGDTTSGVYDWVEIKGDGTTTTTSDSTDAGSVRWQIESTSNQMAVAQFLDAKATDKFKTVLVRAGNAAYGAALAMTTWTNTNAITSLTVQIGVNLTIGTTISLYGVVA